MGEAFLLFYCPCRKCANLSESLRGCLQDKRRFCQHDCEKFSRCKLRHQFRIKQLLLNFIAKSKRPKYLPRATYCATQRAIMRKEKYVPEWAGKNG